jgi:hypothetical protein
MNFEILVAGEFRNAPDGTFCRGPVIRAPSLLSIALRFHNTPMRVGGRPLKRI